MEDEVINSMIAKMIRACIDRLETDEIELVQALYYQGVSMREYAKSIDVAGGGHSALSPQTGSQEAKAVL